MAKEKELVIIGGGVAGLTSAIYACRKGLDSVLLEAELPMGQTATAPIVENYPGFPEGIPGMELVKKEEGREKSFGAGIRTFEPVKELRITKEERLVSTNKDSYKSLSIVIAVGAKPVKLPGELGVDEKKFVGKGLSYCATCDGPLFRGKHVVVIGKDNEAFNEAIYLADICGGVTLVSPGEIEADKLLVERFTKRGEIVLGVVKRIRGAEKVESVILENGREIKTEGVFVSMGKKTPSIEIFEKAGIKTLNRFIEVNRRQETNIPGVFAAGDVTGPPFQIAKAVGEACVATENAYKYVKKLGKN
ncbi:MAG: thioredoxin-disulfide reductase [Methanobacteriota archaeon]|nr:MAG: thioredoxin-disulfide reductase [Euryarchaeota archaeon]